MISRPLARRLLVAALSALVVCGSTAAQSQNPATGKNFLWRVQSGPRTMYLAGSVHALTAEIYPLNPAFEKAFQASDTLVEEIDLSTGDLLALAPLLMARGLYTDGRTFDQAVSKDTLALVLKRLESPGAAEVIRTMKPWMVMLMMTAMQVQQAGLSVSHGLDKYFFDKAKLEQKAIVGLETAESQIDRFDRMPEPLQEQLLRSALEEADTAGRELATIVAAWQRGDAATLEKTLLSGFTKYPAAYRSLIVERNHNWMPQLDTCLARTTPCLVVVGAAHLVGPDGLLTLLRKKGYTIEQL